MSNKDPTIEGTKRVSMTSENYFLLNNYQDDEEIKGEIPRETLRNLYGTGYEDLTILLKLEEDITKQYFREIIPGLEERYQQFNMNMNTHFIDLTNKITEAFKIDNNNMINANNLGLQMKNLILYKSIPKNMLKELKKL